MRLSSTVPQWSALQSCIVKCTLRVAYNIFPAVLVTNYHQVGKLKTLRTLNETENNLHWFSINRFTANCFFPRSRSIILIKIIIIYDFRKKKRTTDVYKVSNSRTGKGISLQPIPDKEKTNRNCPRVVSHGETNQNLVPESADEMEKGKQIERRTWFRWRGLWD